MKMKHVLSQSATLVFASVLAAGLAHAMDFIPLSEPTEMRVDGQPAGSRVTLAADGTLTLHGGTASTVTLAWRGSLGADTKVFGDGSRATYDWE